MSTDKRKSLDTANVLGGRLGRKPKLCEELIVRFCDLLSQSPVITDTCAKAGISDWSYYDWTTRGKATSEDIDNGDVNEVDLNAMEFLRLEFYRRTAKAIKVTRHDIASNWTKEAKTDWRAGRAMLMATDPGNWAPPARASIKAEVSGADGDPVRVNLGLESLGLEGLREIMRSTADLADEDDIEDGEER